MKNLSLLVSLLLLILSCQEEKQISSIDPINWKKRAVTHYPIDSLYTGRSYLSVYSQIYSRTEHITHDLTATVSLRNTSVTDTIFIEKATYFNTKGTLIRTYINQTIFIAPMETVEIVIDEDDQDGGTGANFVFDWKTTINSSAPLFEAIMISTSGQQGISFTTQGIKIK